MMFDLEKQKMELEKERAVRQSENDRLRAEGERDLLRDQLKKNFSESLRFREGRKEQNELLAKLSSFFERRGAEDKKRTSPGNRFVAELIGYQAVKRLSSEIIRSLNGMVGLGNEVRILIVDRFDYAEGDLPLIEVTSQFSVLEVRCRKQVAANKDLSDEKLAGLNGEEGAQEKTGPVKFSPTRLSPIRSSTSFFPESDGITRYKSRWKIF